MIATAGLMPSGSPPEAPCGSRDQAGGNLPAPSSRRGGASRLRLEQRKRPRSVFGGGKIPSRDSGWTDQRRYGDYTGVIRDGTDSAGPRKCGPEGTARNR